METKTNTFAADEVKRLELRVAAENGATAGKTDLAKKAREEAGFLGKVRQFASNQGEIEDADPQSLKSKSEEVTMGTVKSAPVVTDDPHS